MRDQTALIECRGGLNETVSELEVGAGEVRRSLNYEQVPEGGYRVMGGTRRWSAETPILRLEHITVVEVSPKVDQDEQTFEQVNTIYSSPSSDIDYRIVASLPRDNSTLYVLEKDSATAEFLMNENVGLYTSQNIIDLEPNLNVPEQTTLINTVNFFGETLATRPIGFGDTVLIHGHKFNGVDSVFVVRMNGANSSWLQYANEQSQLPNWSVLGAIANPGTGRWEAYSYLFEGTGDIMFMVNGTMPAQSYIEGVGITPINVPGVTAFPTHVIVHKNHLFLSFPGGRIIHSDIGNPYSFSAATGGAGELGFGQEITGFQILPGNSLAIFGNDKIGILSGDDATNWQLDTHTDEAGAIAGSIQNLPTTIFADQRGITTLNASDHYGNFVNSTLSHRFHPLYKRIITNNTLYSSINRDKSQYRLYNEDGSGIHLTFTSGALVGGMEVDLKRKITAMGTVRHGGEDVVYFASEEGWVMRMDHGITLSGFPLDAFLEFPYHHYNSPRQKKRFKEVVLDLIGDPRTELDVTNSVERGEPFHCDASPIEIAVRERTKPGYRTSLISRFTRRFRGVAYTEGTGFDQSLLIKGNTYQHTINSITVHYKWRGQKK